MYNTYTGGCNILNLQLSRHKTIEVKSNNNKSWDYTNPLLPVGEPRLANGQSDNNQNMMSNSSGNMGNKNIIADHPLLPIPMNIAAAAAAAAAAAQHGHHFNPAGNNPYMTHNPHQSHQNSLGSQQGHQQGGGHYSSNNISAQSVTGYPIQQMDNRPAVVQVSNFPDQVCKSFFDKSSVCLLLF